MDSFELNKIIGALLAAVFVIFSVSLVSESLFESHAPEQAGFAIAVEEGGDEKGDVAKDTGPALIGALLASADVDKGKSVFKKCAACHTVENGGANKVGPNLWSIVNRAAASQDGFAYSGALKDYAKGGETAWDYESLNQFLLSPRKYLKGTSMGFAGLKKEGDRANIIAYLRTLSDSPAPLPEASADDGDGTSASTE